VDFHAKYATQTTIQCYEAVAYIYNILHVSYFFFVSIPTFTSSFFSVSSLVSFASFSFATGMFLIGYIPGKKYYYTLTMEPACSSESTYNTAPAKGDQSLNSHHHKNLKFHLHIYNKAVPLHAVEALGGRGGIVPTHSRPRP
jgi:hypothetical protein